MKRSKCKVCNLPYDFVREEIEEMIRNKVSFRKIAQHLKDKHGYYDISYGSIYRHSKHMKEEIEESKTKEKKHREGYSPIYVVSARTYRSRAERDEELFKKWSKMAFGN